MARIALKPITLGEALAGLKRLDWTVRRQEHTEHYLVVAPDDPDGHFNLANNKAAMGGLLAQTALLALQRHGFFAAIREADLLWEAQRVKRLEQALLDTPPLAFDPAKVGPRGMYTEDVLMTPAMWQHLLNSSRQHPRLRLRHATFNEVKKWKQRFLGGEWRESDSGIGVSGGVGEPLFLMNGQHRGLGAVAADATEWVRVTFGVPESAYSIYDVAKRRSLKDTADTGGVETSKDAASALKLLWCYDQMLQGHLETGSWRKWPGLQISSVVFADWARANPQVASYEARAQRIYRSPAVILTAATMAFESIARSNVGTCPQPAHDANLCAPHCAHVLLDRLEAFLQQVEHGEHVGKGDPAKTLRDWTATTKFVRPLREVQLLAYLRAWNEAALGRPLTKLSITNEHVMPVVWRP